MRILILNWRDIKHPLAGGAEISTHEHAKRWKNAGHSVIQFSSSFQGAKTIEEIDGITVIRKGSHYTVHIHAFWFYITKLKNKIDLIVDEFHFIPFFTPLYARAKKLAFIHETAEEVWFKNQIFPISLLGFVLEPVSFLFYRKIQFMTVSESSKKDLVKFGIEGKKIAVIHNGFSAVKSSESKSKKPILIYLGRLAKDKGTEDAIIAFSRVKIQYPETVLWVVGREEVLGYLEKMKKLSKRLNLKDIIFYGHVSEQKKFDLLKKSWILVHPSAKEGWGFTVIEAASQDTPTVGYDTAGLRDSIIDGKTGLLAKNRNVEDLGDKIKLLLENVKLYNSLSKNALEWSKKFSWKDSTSQSLSLIESIL